MRRHEARRLGLHDNVAADPLDRTARGSALPSGGNQCPRDRLGMRPEVVKMNARGNPESLVPSHPGNTNAAKSGVYSSRLRVSRAEEIAWRFAKQTVLEVAERAVIEEVAALRELEAALLGAIERFGVSTRAGAGRGHLDQLSRVSRQLERLAGETWLQEFDDPTLTRKTDPAATTVELPDGAGSVGDDQGRLVSIRCASSCCSALRDALDEDLRRNGAVSRRGGERRQVGQRRRRLPAPGADDRGGAARRCRILVSVGSSPATTSPPPTAPAAGTPGRADRDDPALRRHGSKRRTSRSHQAARPRARGAPQLPR